MTAWLTSVLAGSLQLAVVTAVAWLIVLVSRVRAPRVLLLHYQIALVAGLALPFVSSAIPQPDQPAAVWQAANVIAAIDGPTGPGASRLAPLVAAILLLGIGARALWLIAGFVRLRRYRQAARPFDHLPAAVAVLQSALGIRARWFAGEQVPSPATYGVRRPVVLLPAHVASLPDATMQMVACHELVHIARRDWVSVVAEEIIRTLFWFHPAIWFLLDRIHLHREQVVDERVCAALGDRRAYASALLDLVGSDNALQPQLVSGWLQARHLRARIHTIMRRGSMSTRRLVLTATLLAATLATSGVWAAQAFPVQSGQGATSASTRRPMAWRCRR
jgi:beta-lactamase regulating signal transducer with metallopeptidase domain